MTETILIAWLIHAAVISIVAYTMGRNDERTKRDNRTADRMRAALRDLDARTDAFAPLSALAAQSSCPSAKAGAGSTAISPLPPMRRRCPRGPGQCECYQCLADGVPPRP